MCGFCSAVGWFSSLEFFLNTACSAKRCEWPSFKSEGKINTQCHEDISSVLYIISAKLFFFFHSHPKAIEGDLQHDRQGDLSTNYWFTLSSFAN